MADGFLAVYGTLRQWRLIPNTWTLPIETDGRQSLATEGRRLVCRRIAAESDAGLGAGNDSRSCNLPPHRCAELEKARLKQTEPRAETGRWLDVSRACFTLIDPCAAQGRGCCMLMSKDHARTRRSLARTAQRGRLVP